MQGAGNDFLRSVFGWGMVTGVCVFWAVIVLYLFDIPFVLDTFGDGSPGLLSFYAGMGITGPIVCFTSLMKEFKSRGD